MKKSKILLFILSAIFVLGMFSSCTTNADEISVQLTIRAGDDRIYNGVIKINVENPTVIHAINEAIAQYELDITLDSSGNSVLNVKKYVDTEIDGIAYFWMYTINGVEPTTGRASANEIKDGDKIEYIFQSYDPGTNPPATGKTTPYKSEWGLFGESEELEEETEEETAEEAAAE